MSKKDLIAGANRKPGGKRTSVILSGAARALAKLHGEKTMAGGIETALKNAASLADKVQLIHDGLWGMPQFDEDGLMLDSGFENLNYEPSRLVMEMVENLEEFFLEGSLGDITDPINLQMAIQRWGFNAVHAAAKNYSFDGWPKLDILPDLKEGDS